MDPTTARVCYTQERFGTDSAGQIDGLSSDTQRKRPAYSTSAFRGSSDDGSGHLVHNPPSGATSGIFAVRSPVCRACCSCSGQVRVKGAHYVVTPAMLGLLSGSDDRRTNEARHRDGPSSGHSGCSCRSRQRAPSCIHRVRARAGITTRFSGHLLIVGLDRSGHDDALQFRSVGHNDRANDVGRQIRSSERERSSFEIVRVPLAQRLKPSP